MIAGFKPTAALSGLLMTAALAGCATGSKLAVPSVVTSGERLQILWLHTYKVKDGLRVQGHVRRPPQTFGAVGGHLHVIAYFSDGSPPLAVDTRWGTLPSQGNRMAPFAALVRTANPDGIDRIAVEYRAVPRDA